MLNPSSGTYSWTYLDENIKLAQENDAQIIYTFGRTPKWATANGSCTGSYAPNGCEEAPVEADWDAFVTAIVDHVGPGVIKYWELWNEANLTGEYWNGTDAQLVQMAADARKIIKAVDPNAIILSPSETDNYTGSTACPHHQQVRQCVAHRMAGGRRQRVHRRRGISWLPADEHDAGAGGQPGGEPARGHERKRRGFAAPA